MAAGISLLAPTPPTTTTKRSCRRLSCPARRPCRSYRLNITSVFRKIRIYLTESKYALIVNAYYLVKYALIGLTALAKANGKPRSCRKGGMVHVTVFAVVIS